LNWAIEAGMKQERLSQCFLGPHRFLRSLPKVEGWVGMGHLVGPSGQTIKRGRGYAIVLIPGEEFHAWERFAPSAVAEGIGSRLNEAAAALGAAVEHALHGDGQERSFNAILTAAEQSDRGLSAGVSDIARIDDVEGFEFFHLGSLPFISDDDGVKARIRRDFDCFEIRICLYGNVVPIGTRGQ